MHDHYLEAFKRSGLTYANVANALGTCELTARNKINGKTKLTNADKLLLDTLFNNKEEDDSTCTSTILRHNR